MLAGAALKKWVYRIGGAVFCLLALLELVLRLGLGFGKPLLMQADAKAGYLYQANQEAKRFGKRTHINAFHQRSEETTALPAPGVRRILCLGDSVTFGTTLCDQSDTWPYLLQKALQQKVTYTVEVLSGTAGGWAIGNEVGYLQDFATFGAQTLVWEIGTHDLIQPFAGPDVVGHDPQFPEHWPVLALQEFWGRYTWPRLRHSLGQNPAATPLKLNEADQFNENMHEFSQTVQVVIRNGCQVVVLLAPNANEVLPGQRVSSMASYKARFITICQSFKVPTVDLSVLWQGKAEEKWFRDGVHLTESGNREVMKCMIVDRL